MISKEVRAHLFAILAITIWGTTFISTKVLLTDFTPIELLVFRFVIGYVVLLCLYPKKMDRNKIKDELLLAGAGLSGVTLYFLIENIALTYTSASNVGVIVSVAPFFIAVCSYIFLKEERPTLLFFVGFLFSMMGIVMVTFNGASLDLNPFGDMLALMAAFCWAIYSMFIKKISSFNHHPIQVTRRVFFYGLLFMIPVIIMNPINVNIERLLVPANFLNILFLGLGASAICFVIWNLAVDTLGAIKTSVYIYLNPVISVITAMIVLNEQLTFISAIGIVSILFGLFLSEWGAKVTPLIRLKLKSEIDE